MPSFNFEQLESHNSQSPQPKREYIQGTVERVTYHAEDSGYTVARFHVPGRRDLVTVVGRFPAIAAGQSLRLTGFWREHPKYGEQFQALSAQETKPATLTGIEKYLGSGLIKGIGPVTAKRIVAHFQLDTLEIIEQTPARLVEVPGIGASRAQKIASAWAAQKAIKEVMIFLQGHGVSPTYAVKIYKQYGDEAIEIVSRNPYQLATDIYGIGFITADTIARNLGIAPDSDFRYQAGILHILGQASDEGHCFLPETVLVERSVEQLALPEFPVAAERILALLGQMVEAQELIAQAGYEDLAQERIYYSPAFYHTEAALARRLSTFVRHPVEVDQARVQRWIEGYTQKKSIELSEEQRHAVELAASSRLLVLTGGPGCGKTFTTRTIVALWKAMGKSLLLAAPTGRAAQRLAEVSGHEAKTVHRLLAFDPKTMGFRHNEENPLVVDVLVVDEVSMLDLFLAHSLFKALPPHAQILLVGDSDQLPSVGPGMVLYDMIASRQVPVVRLTSIFRQAAESHIIMNAHRINAGQFPQLTPTTRFSASDCLWLEAAEPELGAEGIAHLVQQYLPAHGIDPIREVQILSPSTRGDVGTRQLNALLQELLNPRRHGVAELARGSGYLRVGDRVIQQVNDYQREVFNGDLGTIKAIDVEEQELVVQFAEREVHYDYADLGELSLAWAITIHKSQGSEYPVVILPLFTQHYMLLSRNLLYTGLTRAQRRAILVGPTKAIGMAVNCILDRKRYTALADRLKGMPETTFEAS
ncbi:ATP-dependent RecD-like DNA helicase [Ktedonobacter sp. SOSP1-52]|uniref:SF1B family DNA helicase RecD2 n=1 Tax=Ktedonobacter sp. SOSP1-52 TaxID=2778366 RepID=UPI0019158CF5|nr:ATP-dependent RecD-like DNA helicase [Ktedonobacter sp. SOSP1-52]GHO70857.1 ATP-dependent RecD-like DNA helicase [Ktedonobacter sp. SOSP1-52]